MSHRHISKNSQKNKPHSKSKGKSSGKVDNVGPSSSATSSHQLAKDNRNNKMAQLRKQKRDDLLMKRRGLNFITDEHEFNLDQETIESVE